MATLKDHQQAMVDLLASGSGIPASASRLAHAMHDVLAYLGERVYQLHPEFVITGLNDATTPGLNDKALAADVEACQIKLTGAGGRPKADLFDRARAAERRVKELENTVKQLRASNAELRVKLDCADNEVMCLRSITDSGVNIAELISGTAARGYILRANSAMTDVLRREYLKAALAELTPHVEQAGCRKDDTQVCEHDFRLVAWCSDLQQCSKCGAAKK